MITIITGNATKFAEMEHALKMHGLECVQEKIDLPEIQTLDQIAAVSQKAKDAFAQAKKPVLVDDSGFFVTRYHAFPGVLSKHVFAMLGYNGLFRLLSEGEPAYFQCSVAYMDSTMNEPRVFTAKWHGAVTLQFDPTTTQHAEMPYVPLFVPEQQPEGGESQSLAHFSADQRSSDHRHLALAAFAEWFQSR